MHLFVDISSHGFGHLAISAPVLNALAEIVPNLQLTVRSALPYALLQQRIRLPFHWINAASDFGYRMMDATRIDAAASAQAYRQTHADWEQRVRAEVAVLAALRPDLVVTCVSYLPLAAAARLKVPACSLCSLNWADLFAHFFGGEAWAPAIYEEIRAAYRAANVFLRVTPAMPMLSLPNTQCVGPVAQLGQAHDLGLGDDKVVLVAMGGIEHRLPVAQWPVLSGWRWLVPASWRCRHPQALAVEDFGLSFTDLLCSVDAVVTKPGYGTFTEAACNGTPLLYVRRVDWPEQDCLIDWLHDHGRVLEISEAALHAGQLSEALALLWEQPLPSRPVPAGGREAADCLRQMVLGQNIQALG